MKTCFFALFTLLLVTVASFAQPPDTMWTHAYGGTNLDDAYGVTTTSDGGLFIVGRSRSFSQQFDVWLVRTDAVGDTLWTRAYGGAGYDHGAEVCENELGGAAIVGWTQSYGAGGMDMYVIYTAADGDTLWTRVYGSTADDFAHAVTTTTDGSIVVGGSTWVTAHNSLDVALMKISGDGTLLWSRTYGGGSLEEAFSVKQTDEGGYLACGRGVPPGGSRHDMYAIRTNSNGDTVWTRYFGTSDAEEATGIVYTADGGCALGGWRQYTDGSNNDIVVVKVSAAGQQQWLRTYGGPNFERCYAFEQATDGGFIIGGTKTTTTASNEFYFVKIDNDGDTLWTRTNGGTNGDYLYDVAVTSDGGYVGAGSTLSFGHGSIDYWAVRLPGFAGVGGIVRDIVTNEPLPNVWVGAVGQAHRIKTDAVGHYVLTLPPGASYDIITSGQCVARDTVLNIPVFEDSITALDITIGVPVGEVSRTSVNVVAYNHVEGHDSFRVYNRGLGILDVSVTLETYVPPTAWLTADPAIAQVNPGDSLDIVVSVLADTTDDGVFDFVGAMTVHMNSCPDSAVHIDVIATILDADEPATLPTTYELTAYPNPFNPATMLEFALPREEQATLFIYDVMGREVRTLQQGLLTPGVHHVSFDANKLPSGIYFARLQTPSTMLTRKLLLLR